jgi:YgiT-type zinc finger domain-containing protein
MGRYLQKEDLTMKCHVCGGSMRPTRSDMPFKLDQTRIVIIRDLPVHQCSQCGEHAFDDVVMVRVEETLTKVDRGAELEVVRFAA